MKRLPLSRLDGLFAAIAAEKPLYIPADQGGVARFLPWEPGMALTEDLNTARSAKDLFFPQVENLVDFKRQGKEIEILEARDPAEPFVLFGVRACDVRSFEILDRVFLQEPVDTFYEARRQNATIVALACGAPEETCFCTAFSIDPAAPGGDVSAWMTEDALLLSANTEKGEALLQSLSSLLEDGGDEAVAEAQAAIREITARLPLSSLSFKGLTPERTLEVFSSKLWASLSEACLGCGTCTFVCPTCQCYDIREFDNGRTIRRFRCWDSCMYSDFTRMSAGQPRPTQKERFRQRFMHKLFYFPENNEGVFGCVGCGRCLRQCPIHMNIVKVASALREEQP